MGLKLKIVVGLPFLWFANTANFVGAMEIVQQRLVGAVVDAALDREAALDAEIERLDALKEDDLEELRRKRLEQMKSVASARQKKLASGHGSYDMIDEKDFFDCAKKSDR